MKTYLLLLALAFAGCGLCAEEATAPRLLDGKAELLKAIQKQSQPGSIKVIRRSSDEFGPIIETIYVKTRPDGTRLYRSEKQTTRVNVEGANRTRTIVRVTNPTGRWRLFGTATAVKDPGAAKEMLQAQAAIIEEKQAQPEIQDDDQYSAELITQDGADRHIRVTRTFSPDSIKIRREMTEKVAADYLRKNSKLGIEGAAGTAMINAALDSVAEQIEYVIDLRKGKVISRKEIGRGGAIIEDVINDENETVADLPDDFFEVPSTYSRLFPATRNEFAKTCSKLAKSDWKIQKYQTK